MRTTIASVIALCLASIAAQAGSMVGDWTGTGTAVTIGIGGNGAEELANLDILSATPGGLGTLNLSGTLDVTCVGLSASQCGTGGVVDISGSLFAGTLLDWGPAGNPNGFAGIYSGGNSFTGLFASLNGDLYHWNFASAPVSAPEIDTAETLSALALLAGGLALIRGRRRAGAQTV